MSSSSSGFSSPSRYGSPWEGPKKPGKSAPTRSLRQSLIDYETRQLQPHYRRRSAFVYPSRSHASLILGKLSGGSHPNRAQYSSPAIFQWISSDEGWPGGLSQLPLVMGLLEAISAIHCYVPRTINIYQPAIDYYLKPVIDYLGSRCFASFTGFTTIYMIKIPRIPTMNNRHPFYKRHYYLGSITLLDPISPCREYTLRLMGDLKRSGDRSCLAFVDVKVGYINRPLGRKRGVVARGFDFRASPPKHYRSNIGNIKICGGENYPVNQWLEPHDIGGMKFKPPKAHETRQELQYRRYTQEKSTQRLHYTQSEASYSSPLGGEFPDLQENGPGLWGRKKLATWKESFGRSKEWRCCRYLKATKQQVKGISFTKGKQQAQISWNPFLLKVPINALRRNVGFKLRSYIRSRKFFGSNDTGPPYFTEEVLWNDFDSDTEDNETKRSSEALQPTPSILTDSLTTQRGQTNPIFSNLSIPYENFVGAILGSSFRVLCILRSENHGDVYAVEDLSPSPDRYEAKSYILRGIPPKLYNYRVRNLKKLVAKPLFLCSLEQNGRTFVINRLDKKVEGPFKISEGSKLGAIGRRNTPEFDAAFPELPKPYKSSIDCTATASLLTAIQPQLIKEARNLLPLGASEPVTLAAENYASVLRSDLLNGEGESGDSNTTTALGTSDQKKGSKEKKPKTPQQIERNRVRQWQSRKRKRAQRKADSVKEVFSL